MTDWKHPNDMDRDELRELVGDMSYLALDLAQHLSFTNKMLREEFREEAYGKAQALAYELSSYPYHGPQFDRGPAGLAVFGETGLDSVAVPSTSGDK